MIARTSTSTASTRLASPTTLAERAWTAIAHAAREAIARRRQRLALAALDDRLLDDVGITREAARAEVARGWRQ